ncbi:hypothetical protein TRAPUB_1169 [Trametes pubescens]|uniref:C2H2-type domain-containing protein n=1 Tax=Trametes pubescens TaxID=154538 RepID=A0A1M2VK62_TRAPU|nr:hypothetical protein TRAPUB_1169 [Trametes pubescens]
MHSANSSPPMYSDVEPAIEVYQWWTDPLRPGSADLTSSALGPVFDAYAGWPHGTYDHTDLRRSPTPPYASDIDAIRDTTPPPVMCPAPLPHPVYVDALACSSYAGTNSGQMVQQYPLDAVATSASGGMSARATAYSSLTNWAGAITAAAPAQRPLPMPTQLTPTQPPPAQPAPQANVAAAPECGAPGARKPPPTPRRRQSTEKKFPCPYYECIYVSAREYNLRDHIRTVHLGERPFPCPDCPEAFKKKHDMQRHHQSWHTNLGSPRNNAPRRK